ncbi:MAG: hypothetical protein NC411_07065 [Bacteroides sp.]|nr:hypothetical protein [Bacteroides sp.]
MHYELCIKKVLKRAWRSRGFGIHSPFAYRFVTAVLRERGEYYSYFFLRRIAGSKDEFRRLALVFRLVCEFTPDRVVLTFDDAGLAEAIRLADSRVSVSRGHDMDVTVGSQLCIMRGDGGDSLRAVEGVRAVGGRVDVFVIFNLPPERYRAMTGQLGCGMTFYNLRTAVVVVRADLSRQDFEVNF